MSNNKEVSPIWHGLVAIVIGVSVLLTGKFILENVFPEGSQVFNNRIKER